MILLLFPFAGCSGGESRDEVAEGAKKVEVEAIAGSFVGEVSGTKAFIAVVAAPPAGEQDARAVQVYISDGRRLNEWFPGSTLGNSFLVTSDDGTAEAEGELAAGSVKGTVELPGGKTVEYEAGAPSGPAGLYDVTLSPEGELSGASAGGLGVTGEITMGRRGTGKLRLVDGKRLEFDVAGAAAGALAGLRAGQIRLIILPSGELRGAGKTFFVRSS